MRFHDAGLGKARAGRRVLPLAGAPTSRPSGRRCPCARRSLTAWAGGPRAARLTGKSHANARRQGAGRRARIFPDAQLASALVQDWQQDPFSRGGYSYVLVGGSGARETLASPLGDTLYFAGEATDTDEAGTVAGALRSGQRAARESAGDPACDGGKRPLSSRAFKPTLRRCPMESHIPLIPIELIRFVASRRAAEAASAVPSFSPLQTA